MKIKEILIMLIIIFILYLYSKPRYISWLPTMYFIYNNKEADETYKYRRRMTREEYKFFRFTDMTIAHAFKPHVNESIEELYYMIDEIDLEMSFFKLLINRPRPYQINKKIDYLESQTNKTPSMPAGHAYAAYYLEKKLSKKYPEKKEIFKKLAKKCDMVRVKAGIHYKSDGELSKKLVDYFH